MPKQPQITSQISIRVAGAELPPPALGNLASVTVEQHVHLPAMFMLAFHDPELKLLDSGPLDLTKTVEIAATTKDGEKVTLVQGEITALEPHFGEGMIAQVVFRGYDRSHRLYREIKSQAYLNKKDSDLADELARAHGLQAQVEPTQIVYDHIYQHNQSDLAFMMQRAWRIGYECYVDEGKLHFRRPPSGGNAIKLTWGGDLLWFRPHVSLAEQVDEVVVKGWDPENLKPIIGRAQNGSLYPKIGETKDGAAWAGAFGNGKTVIVNQPVVNQSEADTLARARLDELSGAFIDAEGEAFRRPDIRAGRMVKLDALGKRLSGTYLVSRATHRYTPEGLKTVFYARGARAGLIFDELGGAPRSDGWPGLVIGMVTNTDDPKGWGRVKVKFPWLVDDAESDWARVIGSGAGPEAGFISVPDVGDEVAIAFALGDFSQPFVLGGLWNGKHKVPPESAKAGRGEKPLVRVWRSRKGHRVVFYDNADRKIEIATADGHKVVLDDARGTMEVISKGNQKLSIDDRGQKVSVEAGNIEVKAKTSLKLEASASLEIKCDGTVSIKGAMVNLNP